MLYVLLILLIVFCIWEGYGLFMAIRKKRAEKKSLKSQDSSTSNVEENSQEILEKGENQD